MPKKHWSDNYKFVLFVNMLVAGAAIYLMIKYGH